MSYANKEHQSRLGHLGEETELRNHTSQAFESFVCTGYTVVKVAGTKLNDVRYLMFFQKGQRNENLSPVSDRLQQHTKQRNYQDCEWKKALEATQNLPSPNEFDWKFWIMLCKALDDRKYVGAVLMDLSKAFDCMPHNPLLAKLQDYGLSNEAITLMRSYLTGRRQRVKIGSTTSAWLEIQKGVPQGSIVGPLLFNVFFMS